MGGRVLVVDDSPLVRSVFRAYLTAAGLGVVEASDGEDALEIARGDPPTLVIADVNMPFMDGLTLLSELRSDPRPELRTVPVILVTGEHATGVRTNGLAAGADDFFRKPVRFDELMTSVRRLLERERVASPT